MTVRTGVSGWSYRRWRGDFYPQGLADGRQLAWIAERMSAAEVNASFYRLQRPSTYLSWVAQTPPHFRLALKGSRYITHLKGLRGCRQPLATFLASGPLALRDRLGPLLWQLPASHVFDADRLDAFLSLLPRTTGEASALASEHDGRQAETFLDPGPDLPVVHVLEPRHESFRSAEAVALLEAHGVGTVIADSAGAFPTLDAVTSRTVYVRLHGHERLYHGGYGDGLLDLWARRARAWDADGLDVWFCFDNDADGRAPYDAVALGERLADLLPLPDADGAGPG